MCIDSIVNIESFLRELYIFRASEEGGNITWIELYILYRISRNQKPLDIEPQEMGDKSKQVIPLDLQFKHFKKQVRCIVDRNGRG